MSSAQVLPQDAIPSDEESPPTTESGKNKRAMDKGFSRNLKILGVVLALAILVTAVIVVRSQSAIRDAGEKKMPSTVIDPVSTESAGPSQITQAEIDRIMRVGREQSAEAAKAGQTYIPNNLPLSGMPNMPDAGQGPGAGYNPNTGRHNGNNVEDARRDQYRDQGLQLQLQNLLKGLEAPATQSAGPYESKDKNPQGQSAQQAQQATVAKPVAAIEAATEVVAGLSIHGAELTSPLDTAKTDYVSARIVSGPASGGLLFGKGVVVGEEGVRVLFNKLSLKNQTYDVNVVALDTQTSSNALSAEIDRKVFSRYVIPIFGAIGKAYADAVARPNQQVIVDGGAVGVVTPAASARQAAAAGVGAGIGKVTQAATYDGPNTAFMAEGSHIGVLFLDSVKAKK